MALSTGRANDSLSEQFMPIQMQDKLGQLRESFGGLDARVRTLVKERPFVTVLTALASGYFLGRLIAKR